MFRPSEAYSLIQMELSVPFVVNNLCEKLFVVVPILTTLTVAIFSWLHFSNVRVRPEGSGDSQLLTVLKSDEDLSFQKSLSMLKSDETGLNHKKDSIVGASFPFDDQNTSPKPEDLNALKEILKGITIPSRRLNVTSCPVGTLQEYSDRHNVSVYPDCIYPGDLERFLIASDYDLRTAAVRLVQTAVFRGEHFPIDFRFCYKELQKGQFLVQGRDKESNPIIYFRVQCLGEWKKDFNATVAAATYQVESVLQKQLLSIHKKNDTKFTLIIWIGKPEVNEISSIANADRQKNHNQECVPSKQQSKVEHSNKFIGSIDKPEEEEKVWQSFLRKRHDSKNNRYYHHCNFNFAQRLIKLFLNHYPERLSKALVVPSTDAGLDLFWGKLGLRAYAPPSHTRDKVFILKGHEDLKKYVSVDELVVWCGGNAPVIERISYDSFDI